MTAADAVNGAGTSICEWGRSCLCRTMQLLLHVYTVSCLAIGCYDDESVKMSGAL